MTYFIFDHVIMFMPAEKAVTYSIFKLLWSRHCPSTSSTPSSIFHTVHRIAAAMSKRDLALLSATANVGLEPRTKRRKETQSVERDDVIMTGDSQDTKPAGEEGGQEGKGANEETNEEVKGQGLALWQTVKDAVNKECVTGNCDSRFAAFLSLSMHITLRRLLVVAN